MIYEPSPEFMIPSAIYMTLSTKYMHPSVIYMSRSSLIPLIKVIYTYTNKIYIGGATVGNWTNHLAVIYRIYYLYY